MKHLQGNLGTTSVDSTEYPPLSENAKKLQKLIDKMQDCINKGYELML